MRLTAAGRTLDAVSPTDGEGVRSLCPPPTACASSHSVYALVVTALQRIRIGCILAVVLSWWVGSAALNGQTNIAIGNTTVQPSVKRLGINLGTLTNYDSGQITKNLIVGNPGFEGQIWNSTIRCAYGTATNCTDENAYSGWPANFWAGATYQIFYGTAAGRSGTVISSSAAGNGVGVTLNFGDSGTAPAQGDYMIVRQTMPGGSATGWQTSVYGNGTITDNLTDLPPNTLGKQTVVLTAPGASDSAQVQSTFDATNSMSFVQLNGTFQLQFKAKGIGGSNQLFVKVERGSSTPYVYQTLNLSNSWNTYNLTFTANETGAAVNSVVLILSTAYGADSVEIDDVSLTQVDGDPSNSTVFRDSVVNTLRTAQPGIIRFWENNGQLGETLDNLLTPQFGRQRAGSSAFLTQSTLVDYGLHEFLVLCQTVGAEPWIVVPTTFSNADAANLMQYLAGSTSTTYGAKRASLGQTTPWSQIFSQIHLEFGNEAWNDTGFKGGTIAYNEPYGQQAQVIFAAMQGDPSYSQTATGIFDFVLGGQAASAGYNEGIQNIVKNNTSFTIAPYAMSTVDSYADNESLFGSTLAEPEAFMSSAMTTYAENIHQGVVYLNYQAMQQSFHPVPLSFYEMNLSTLQGTITQTALNSYTSSLGAGLMVADTMLQGMQQYGIVNQNLFALPQYDQQRPDGSIVYLWGAVVDMGNTNRKRPQYLALELANQALSSGAAMLQTIQSGANPTWNVALTNTVQFTGAHYIQSYAFQQGKQFSAIVFNLSRSVSLPVTFSGVNAPAGTVLMQQLTSANITDTNENSNVVAITPSTLTSFSSATGLSLPPYSMTVLNWSTSSQAPVISAVMATAITGTSANISWTTDEGSSSLVNYGTSVGYGSSSTLNTTLTTSHSVALTGLTPGTTYNFDAVSANSASPSQSSTSANFTFTTPQPAPVISSLAISAITTNSATITWTTDQASTSQVSYSSTASYSATIAPSTSASSTLVTTHSITLTGLTASSTYNFTVTSANSAGTPATETGSSFTTTGAPVISNTSAASITSTSATITWVTDQPSSSQVLYGTTTAYGSASFGSGTLVTNHSVSLTGLSPNTTYNFDVISANTYGLSTTSANFTFSTSQQAPAISNVGASAVTNTSATLSWTTDQPSTSQVAYGSTISYGSTSTLSSALTTNHSVTLTNLTLGTNYDYEVISVNATNTSSTSTNFSFTTAGGSTTTNIAINGTPLQTAVKRLGITLGTLNNADSGQMAKNLITANPGFEGQVWNSVLQCVAGTANSCTDQNPYSSWPAGYWNGASYQVISGAVAGRSGSVASSTAAGGGQGITLNFADSGTAISAGSYLIVRKTVTGSSSAGWLVSTSAQGTVTDNLSDLPPGTTGQQTVELSAPSSNDYATIATSFDTTSGISFVQLNGTYQLQFKAKALGGSNAVGVVLQRSGGTTFLNQYVTLSSTWNTYNLTFSAAESAAVGSVSLAFNTIYGQDYVELDDVSLTKTNSDPANSTVFRDSVVNALRTAQPGILRYWGGNGQLGETLNNLLTPQFGRQRAGYSEYSVASNQIDYGLHEFLVLCQTIGAEPWFVVPSTFSTTDAANLIDYLAGSSSTTTYGAKRAALGQATPWTQVFSKIHLEFGEQTSGLNLAGGYISDPASYGAQAQVIFAAMQGQGSYSASPTSFDFVLGGSASSPGNIATIQNNCNNNTSFDIAPYTMNSVSSYSTNEQLFGPTFAEPEALMSSSGTAEGLTPGMVFQDYQAVQGSAHVVPLSFSEINLSTLGGTIPQSALNSYVSSLGAGLMVADTMLQGLKQYGVVNQNLYSLPQYTYSGRTDGSTVYLWGSVVDMGVTDRRRPQYLALQLANQALSTGATMLQTVHSGNNPTWDQPLSNSVYLNGAHYLQSYAFQNGTTFSTVLFNLSRTSTLPVTFSGSNAPAGSVQIQQLTSANPTDTNETSNVVSIASSTTSSFSGATGLSLPPYSMTVLTWSTSTQAPAISGVIATGITGTSATISWTTDEPSSSQVQYGTTISYGSSSALNSALSTSHSVTLTGLTPGATYDFNVTSTNAAGTSASTSNYAFNTSLPAPVISAVNVVAVNGTTTTINWTTDQAATSVLNYGTTTSYGTVVENVALVTNHSITVSGLITNGVYDFVVTSANTAGTPTTSGNYTFAVGNPPKIMNVAVGSISASSATITWTTDTSTSSLVNYGTTTAYGSSSSVNPAFVTSHSVTVTGLTAATAYNFDVVSANSVGTYSTSANYTFTTVAGTPVISAVTATGVSSTSETITWTTDQATSSLVNYGTTTGYGTSSTLSTQLVTSHSVTLTGLTAGTTYNFDVVSANSGGTSATSGNSTFTTVAGTPVISAVTATGVSSTSETITWTTDQATSSLVNYGTTTGYGTSSTLSTQLVTSHSVTLTGLTAGTTYNFDVVSANSGGISATSGNSTFTTVAGTPVISVVTATSVSGTSETITWTTDQATSSLVNYGTTTGYGTSSTLNSAMVTSHSVTLTGLTAGTTYNFDVVSANSGGTSATSGNSTFTTVAGTPVISVVTATSVSSTSETITWTTDQATSSLVNYGTTTGYGTSSTLNSAMVTSHSVTLTGLTAGTTYNFDVVSANSGGTSATSGNSTFTTVAGTPVISVVTATSVSSTSETITWTTDQATSSLVNYGTTTGYGTSSTLNSAMVTSHSVTLTGLTAGTVYNYDVVSANSGGTSATSPNSTFTTAVGTPVISSLAVTALTSTGATITWTTDQPTSSLVNYGATLPYGSSSSANAALVTSHSVALLGLTAGTTYNYDVVSTNGSGSTATSANATFATPAAAAPAISAITVSAITNTGATITWTTDQASSSQVSYGTTTAYGTSTTTNAAQVTSHTVTLTGLTAGTLYDFVVISVNAGGSSATSGNTAFTTTGTPAISAVTVTAITSAGATITWTTDQPTTSLVNYGTSSAYGSSSALSSALVTSHSVTLTGLTTGTTYNYDVKSVNGSGTSVTSANATFATTAAPVISAVTATSVSSTSEMITWATDQATSSLVNYGTTTGYGTSSTLSSGLVTSHSVTLTGLTAGTLYNFVVVSANSAGTSATSLNATFTTVAGTPVISAVTATAVSSTSEMITWTTDQATSSLVNYGTTTGYGASSTLSSGLVTSHSVTLTGLTAGALYNFVVVSANSAGTSATSLNATFTTVAGTPVISAVTATAVSSTSEMITWTTDQATSSLVNYGTTTGYGTSSTLSSGLVTSHSVTLTGLTAGTLYNFVVVSANGAGTSATSLNATFTTVAGTPVISAVTATSVSSTSEMITWTTDQATSSLVNYGTTTGYGTSSTLSSALVTSHSVTLTGLTAGTTYNYDVVSTNASSTSAISPNAKFTTVLAAPVISGVTATAVSSMSETITWTTDQATSSLVNYGTSASYGSSSTLNTALVTSHSVTLTGLTAGTTYNYDVVSANASATSSTSPNATFATAAGGTPPQVGYVAFYGVNNSGVTISWSTDVAANTVVAYGTTTALGQLTPVQSTLAASHGVVLTGLNSGTTYYFVCQSTGANGATGYSTTYSFTTTGTAPTPAAPVISAVTATGISSNAATITWTTDQAASSQVNYGTSSAYGSSSTLNTTLATSHSVTLTGLTAGTTYNFDVSSTNSSSSSSVSSNYTFATSSAAGAPVISALTAVSVSNTSETITWTTDVASSSLVNYGTTTSYGTSSALNTTLATSHTVTLTGLTAGTTYNFVAVSATAANASSTSPNATFTTTAGTPVISIVTATNVSSTSETITWTTDQATSSLVNYGTGTSYGSASTLNTTLTTSHSVTLSGLTAGTTYNFDVVSANSAGTSATSPNATFVTPTSTGTPPNLGYVAYWGINNSGITISWSTDVVANTVVAYGTTTALGQFSPVQSSLAASHGVVLTGLNSGTTYYFVCESTGANGATGYSTTYSFTTTGTASPSPVISAVTASGITGTSATITWTTDQASSSQVNYGTSTSYGSSSTLNTTLATSHSVTLTGLTAGATYNFDVVSANASSISSTSTNSTFTTVVTGAPVISAVTASSLSNTSEMITWTTDVASTTQVSYGLTTSYGTSSAMNASLTTSHSVTLTGLTAGTLYDFVVVSASATNVTSTSPNTTFTTTAGTPVISAVTATNISGTSETITWTTDQATSSLVNYGTTTAYGSASTLSTTLTTSHSVTLSGLTAGTTYNFDVVSANSGGTSATSSNATFATPVTTATPPYVGYVAYWGVNNSGVTISWSTDVAANTVVAYGTTNALGSFTAVQSTLATSHGVVLTGLNSGTTYYFVCESTGANGATGYSTTYSFTTTGTASTPAAPVISAVTATSVSSTSETITWTTDQATSSLVNYGTSSAYGSASPLNTALVTSHSVTLSGLTAGTTYNYDVVSANSSSTSSTSSNATFATASGTGAPVISAVTATSVSSTSETITWTTDQATSSLVNYGTGSAYGSASPLNSALVTSHSVTLSGLTAGTTYNYDVVSANSSSTSSTSSNATFATASGTGAPVISAVTATSVSSTSETITWTTDQATSSLVNYGTGSAYGSASTLNTALVTSHSVTLSGLTAGTTYNYDVVSANSSSTSSTSSNATFTTASAVATPVISAVTATSVSSTSETITWTTDQATSSLVNYGTSSAYGSASTLNSALVTSHSVTLSGLTAGTTYYFDVVSTNSNGMSATSTNATFITAGSASGAAPNISYFAYWGITSSGINMSWSTDIASTTQVAYGTTAALGQLTTVQTTLSTSHGVVLTGLTPGKTYYYQAQSTSSAGVTGYSTTYSFTTLTSGPPTVSGITITPNSNNTATISWTTSVATTSYVQYGPTASYNRYSGVTSLTTTPSCALSYVPSGVTHYQLISTDANGNQYTSPDYTFTEP